MDDTCVSNYAELTPDKTFSLSHVPPKGREIYPPNSSLSPQSSRKVVKSVSFKEGTRFVVKDVDRREDFMTRHRDIKMEKQGWITCVPEAYWTDDTLGAPYGSIPPVAAATGSTELGLISTGIVSPTSVQPPPAAWVRPKRRPRPKRQKVAESPAFTPESPLQTPFPSSSSPDPSLSSSPASTSSNSISSSPLSTSSSNWDSPSQLSATAAEFIPAAAQAQKCDRESDERRYVQLLKTPS